MKKINIFALILIMCSVFFAGCGKGQTDTKTQPGNIDSDSLKADDEAYLEENIEKQYKEAMNLIETEEYKKAFDILWQIGNQEGYSEYKESKNAIRYARGMIYKSQNIVGSAIDAFSKAGDFKDSKQLCEELLKTVKKYNGSWYYDNPEHPNSGIGNYIFIDNGRVSMTAESSFNKEEGVFYSDSLAIKYNESNSMDEVFIVGGSVGLSKAIEKDDYEFLIYELPDGSLAVGSQVTTPLASFSGVYKKVADDAPKEKSLGV